MNIPDRWMAGDSVTWNDSPVDVEGVIVDSSYTLTYQFRGPNQLTVVATALGSGWTTLITTTQSATLAAGTYWWAAIATTSGQRITLERGEIVVDFDISTVTTNNYDGRSQAEIALSAAESALATFSGSNGRIKKYTINGRSMEFSDTQEILSIIAYWRIKVSNEAAQKAIDGGRTNPRAILVRFR